MKRLKNIPVILRPICQKCGSGFNDTVVWTEKHIFNKLTTCYGCGLYTHNKWRVK